MTALVDPAIAAWTTIALTNDALVRSADGRSSSHTMSTMRTPADAHMRTWFASIAGSDDAPGSDMPRVSAMAVMVDAVPMTWQVPGERAMPASTSLQSASEIVPARSSVQYFIVCVPTPSRSPRQLPDSMNPAGT